MMLPVIVAITLTCTIGLFSPYLCPERYNLDATRAIVFLTGVIPVALALGCIATTTPASSSAVLEGRWAVKDDKNHSVYGAQANHDFCESNYAYSPYVAELHNTWTSMPIVAMACVGMHYTWRYTHEVRFVLAFGSIGSVGIGSALFHGMLLRWGQVLDEVPMILYLFCMIYMQVERERLPRLGCWFPLALALLCSSIVLLYLVFNFYMFFLVGFISGGALVIFSGMFFLFGPDGDKLMQYLFYRAFTLLCVGICSWFLDDLLCEHPTYPSRWLHLHVVWHFSAAFASYLFVLIHVAFRAKTLGYDSVLVLPNGCTLRSRQSAATHEPLVRSAPGPIPPFFLPYVAFETRPKES